MIRHREIGKLEQEQGQRSTVASYYTAALELIEENDEGWRLIGPSYWFG